MDSTHHVVCNYPIGPVQNCKWCRKYFALLPPVGETSTEALVNRFSEFQNMPLEEIEKYIRKVHEKSGLGAAA